MRWDIIEPLGCLLLLLMSMVGCLASARILKECKELNDRVDANLNEIRALFDRSEGQS